jgi:hypothetical protein
MKVQPASFSQAVRIQELPLHFFIFKGNLLFLFIVFMLAHLPFFYCQNFLLLNVFTAEIKLLAGLYSAP